MHNIYLTRKVYVPTEMSLEIKRRKIYVTIKYVPCRVIRARACVPLIASICKQCKDDKFHR